MPELDLLLPFAAATLIFAFMPEPALLYTAAQTLARGRAGGSIPKPCLTGTGNWPSARSW